MRPRNLLSALCVLAALGTFLGACDSAATPRSSAKSLVNEMNGAVNHAGSVRFTDVTQTGTQVTTVHGALSASAAEETLLDSSGRGRIDLVLHDSTVYIRGPAAALQSGLGLTAAQAAPLAGTWISLTPSDSPFQTLAQDLTPGTELSPLIPTGTHVSVGQPVTVHGHRAIPITGPVPSSTGTKVTGSHTLFLSAATKLPIGASQAAKSPSTRETRIVTFSDWGKPVTVPAPSGATPFSSIPSS